VSDNTLRTSRRRKAILAGVAGFALLLGGSTYALWTSSANLAGGEITAGDLSIAPGTFAAYDISADRVDSTGGTEIVPGGVKGHTIDLGTGATDWKIVPGDEAALVFPYTITLVGDNLIAELKTSANALITANANNDMTFEYAVYDANGAAIVAPQALPASDTTALATFASNDADKGGGLADTVDGVVGADGTMQVTVVLYATFAQTATVDTSSSTSYVNAVTDLSGNMTATLTQVRVDPATGGSQFTPAPTTP